MNRSAQQLRQKRDAVLQQMGAIDHLRRGTLSRQFFKKRQQGRTVQHGPYFVLQCFFKGKKCSERIPAQQAPQVQEQVSNYQRFQQLADEFVSLSDQITQLEAATAESKKNSSPRKSPPSSSGKPEPS
jgi:hypothetical protein